MFETVKLIVIESCDAAGKSSQVKLIHNHYIQQGLKCKFIHFPMYGHNKFSDLISMFLRGEFGDNVDPYFVADIYAMDRFMYKDQLIKDLEENDVVIMDRYVLSNVAYQCAKVSDLNEREKLSKWILDFEFKFLSLPNPSLTLFLDVPITEIEKRLNGNRVGDDRNYLEGKKDIHEKDIELQTEVREIYNNFSFINYHKVKTVDENNKLYNIEELFNSYKKLL